MLSRSGVAVMGGIFALGNFGTTLGGETGSCFDASVGTCYCSGPLRVEKIQLLGLTPAFEHRLCAHMVLLVLGCGGCVSVLLPL